MKTTRYSLIITGHITCVLLYFKLPVTESDMRIDSLRQEVPKHFPIFSFGSQKPSTKGCPLFLPVGHVIPICKSFSLLQVHRYFRPVRSRSSSRKQFSPKSKYPCKEKKTSLCKLISKKLFVSENDNRDELDRKKKVNKEIINCTSGHSTGNNTWVKILKAKLSGWVFLLMH